MDLGVSVGGRYALADMFGDVSGDCTVDDVPGLTSTSVGRNTVHARITDAETDE
jgi:hypothetical protein